jgi:hypothetical protein
VNFAAASKPAVRRARAEVCGRRDEPTAGEGRKIGSHVRPPGGRWVSAPVARRSRIRAPRASVSPRNFQPTRDCLGAAHPRGLV